ncbi:RluA family pseudouridine synthase [Sphingopyxis sp.]|uniref:RluA family pseudouridine synthase n=1 Tax=Sphingopyxis sp. TaxID=1908224 RepID=UPI001D8B5014|nr:RluA family pseudouridine synthase [Sphingopyxis sp.]MBW8294270.1 RluA family pseudouridine synthase [Sphingopyxis sp.]
MTDAKPKLDSATIAEEDDGIRLDRWFKRHREGTPHALLARWARSGQLTLDGNKADVSDRIATGQKLVMPTPPVEAAARPARKGRPLTDADIELATGMMIHRDTSAIVLNKPPGLATQGGTKTDAHVDGLLDALKFDGPTRPKLVHRLDKDTSGALLIARTPKAAAYFAKSFSNRSAKKTYWALIVGVPDIQQGEIDLPLAKQPGSGGEKMHVHDDGLPSKTRYRVIERAGNSAAWVELQPLTGRTHQLRVHMAAIGHPIVGDGKYGGKGAFLTGTISRKMHLHSRRLRIDHPDGGAIDVSAEVPDHFAASLDALGFDLLLGEVGIDAREKGPPPKSALKAQAKAHSKQIRKARRGERRGRPADRKPPDIAGE